MLPDGTSFLYFLEADGAQGEGGVRFPSDSFPRGRLDPFVAAFSAHSKHCSFYAKYCYNIPIMFQGSRLL